MNFDVFNGDADGICALHQIRLDKPLESQLITGVKRDIQLLNKISVEQDDQVLALDISLDKNRDAMLDMLNKGASVEYFDHHFAGDLPEHSNLTCHIDTRPETCTSLIVNEYLDSKYILWAIVGAYGDNMIKVANSYAQREKLDKLQDSMLCELGTLLNYNGYGSRVDDLFFNPESLYRIVHEYENPFDFIQNEKAFNTLKEGYSSDMAKAIEVQPVDVSDKYAIYILPDQSWSRRISGVFGNQLTEQHPARAHAILSQISSGDYVVSVRAPLVNRVGADDLCRQFPSGGGRKAAAGINHLPADQYENFVAQFKTQFAS